MKSKSILTFFSFAFFIILFSCSINENNESYIELKSGETVGTFSPMTIRAVTFSPITIKAFTFIPLRIVYIDDSELWKLSLNCEIINEDDNAMDGVIDDVFNGSTIMVDIKFYKLIDPTDIYNFSGSFGFFSDGGQESVKCFTDSKPVNKNNLSGIYACDIYSNGILVAHAETEITESMVNNQSYVPVMLFPQNHEIISTTTPLFTWAKYPGQEEGSPCDEEFIHIYGPGNSNELDFIFQSNNWLFSSDPVKRYYTVFSVQYPDDNKYVTILPELTPGRYIAELKELTYYCTDISCENHFIQDRFIEFFVDISIPANVNITPKILNSKSKGKWITAHIEVPEHDLGDIDENSITLSCNGENVLADKVTISDDVLVVKFIWSEVESILNKGTNESTITGKLIDGKVFSGTAQIILK